MNSSWIQQRTPLEKTLLSFSFVIILTLVLVILLGITFRGESSDISMVESSLCLTKECIQTANEIISRMSEERNPCTNFYEYSCGGFKKNVFHRTSRKDIIYQLLKDRLESPLDSELKDFQPARSLYNSCMKFDGLKENGKRPDDIIRELMTRFGVGTWPVVDTFFDVDSKLSMDERLVGLAFLGIPVAYKIEVSTVNGSPVLKLSPGGPQESGRTAEEIRDDVKLRIYLFSSFHLLGSPFSRAVTDANDILSVDMGYAIFDQNPESQCTTVDFLAASESTRELNRLIPESNWTILMSNIQKEAGLDAPFAVELHCKERIRDYIVYLFDLTIRSAYNYLGWRFFSTFQKHIVPHVMHPDSMHTPRSKDCIALLEQYVSTLLQEVLTLHYVSNSTVDKVYKMTNNIKTRIQKNLETLNRISSKNKSRYLDQLESQKINLPPFDETIEERSSLHILPQVDPSNFTSVVIELQQQSVIKELKKLKSSSINKESSKDSWTLLMELLAGVGKSQRKRSSWWNYGSLGAIISEELSRPILDEIFSFDWSRCSGKMNELGCAMDSLSDLLAPYSLNETVKEYFMKELFQDVCSLELAYETASSDELSDKKYLPGVDEKEQQLFFLSYAQSFCEEDSEKDNSAYIPNELKVNTVFTTSAIFQKTFHCDSTHQPTMKCSLSSS